jgi:two-component system NtrC family sensor kinase
MIKRELYRKLRFKLVMITLLVSIAPLLALGTTIYLQFAKVYREKVEEQIRNLARSHANALELFLRERTTILSTIVDTHSFATLSDPANLARIFESLNRRGDGSGLVDLGLIDAQGNHLAYAGPFNLGGLNYYQQSWFAQTMSRGRHISDVYLGFRKLPHFVIAVRGHDGERSWILRATIDSDLFHTLVRTAQAGRTGDAFILNGDGMLQTQPRFRGEILKHGGVDPKHFGEGTTVLEQRGADGRAVYYAGTWLKNNEWLLVLTQEAGNEMLGLIRTRNEEILIIALGCLGIVLATIFTTRQTVRRLEEADGHINEMNAQLVQCDKLAALGKMATGIAHEINNPLAVIGEKAGWMRDLLSDETFQESENLREFEKSIEKIEEHVERARKITHNMLGFSRRMEPHLDDVDLNAVIDQTHELLKNHARINAIEIRKELQPDLPVIASDHSQLQQVFLNLINNAIDAIGKEGLITITSRREGEDLLVSVQDSGPGIDLEVQRRVFDPFFTTKETGKGTGLGLSISFSIIEKLGGRLSVSSVPGQGATFTVKLPLKRPEKK